MFQRTKHIAYVVGLALLLAASTLRADFAVLDDQNARAAIDAGSQDGMTLWSINGINYLFQEWFWFGIDDDPEQSIDTLVQAGIHATDTNPFADPSDDHLSILYQDEGERFEIELGLTLRGSPNGGHVSDLAEQIRITNTDNKPLDFRFYQYVDFDLAIGLDDQQSDKVVFVTPNTVRHSNGSILVAETVVVPTPNRHEAALYSDTLDALNDGVVTTLNNVGAAGPGDVTWAFQWNVRLASQDSLLISKDKLLTVPEPSSALLLGTAASALLLRIAKHKGDTHEHQT